MDRQAWLAERRAAVELDYTQDAPSYEIDLYPISEAHRQFVTRVIEACPPDGAVLDIPCGSGRYFELRLDAQDFATGEGAVKAMCEKLLANTVIETYRPEVVSE